MHELIEIFLKEVLRYQGKNSNAVRENVQHLLTACEYQIRDTENDPKSASSRSTVPQSGAVSGD
jgi:hypothetical protein